MKEKSYKIVAIDASPICRKLQKPSYDLLILVIVLHSISHFIPQFTQFTIKIQC